MAIPNLLGFAKAVSARLVFKPLVYGYSNARVRAMRTTLLSRRQAEDLLKVRTNAAVAEYLSKTSYREDFSGMPLHVSDEDRLEIAISRNFARTAQKLMRITPPQGKPMLLAFLGRYDAHNLKTVLLAKKLMKSKSEIQNLLMPAGSLKPYELERMLSAKTPEELYDAIKSTEFGAKFLSSATIRHIPRWQIKAALQHSESQAAQLDLLLSALDSYYYEVASSAASGADRDSKILLGLIRAEADAKNAITIMRMKKGGADKRSIMKHMVEGGSFSKERLEQMAEAKDFNEVAKLASGFFISETGRGEFASAEKKYAQDGQISHFEVVFESSIARRSLKVLRRSMMSIGAIAGFLFLKEEEMNNIRKIVRGKALGIPPEKVAEMLVLVG
ncbi:MAG: V-type ATPase subunit [Candidatus Micrarchaeota archaeon]|nr:V-type ATPase subunit [Candidatus Micrarchaeota archaeon]